MVDVAVKSEAAWACRAQGRPLADVVLPVHDGEKDTEEEELGRSDHSDTGGPVLLEQVEDSAPCVLTLRCSPDSPAAAIGRLLVVSEARTMEVYDQAGGYCGTVRGAEDRGVQSDSADRGPFYRKQLILDQPCTACEVKLLSLAGRSSVSVSRVLVGLRPLRCCPARGPGIDLQQVQGLMEEMGASLSPGAQNLLDMVQIQQKNQSGALGGFLPLLMGGAPLAALAGGGGGMSFHAAGSQPPSAASTPSDVTPSPQNGGMSDCSSSSSCASSSCASSSPDVPMSDVSSTPGGSESGGPVSHAHLADMMSRLLKGDVGASDVGADLLPALQSVCGQVTQLRQRSGWRDLDPAMERRLDEMERRLKEHVDRRLDALEQKLEKVLLGVLATNHAAAGRAASTAPPEELAVSTAAAQ